MTESFELLRGRRRWLARFLPGLALPFLLSGCASHKPQMPFEARYHPSNIYSKGPMLDPDVKRVALLPMASQLPTETFLAGVESLQPLLQAELEKTKLFDVVVVTTEHSSDSSPQSRT